MRNPATNSPNAYRLFERSKNDREVIVGSEIRAAIGELWDIIGHLHAQAKETNRIGSDDRTDCGTFGSGITFEPMAGEHPQEFQHELQHLINRYSQENGSNTPDFIMAGYLTGCLEAFNMAVRARERWYGRAVAFEPGAPLVPTSEILGTDHVSVAEEVSHR